MIRCAFIRSTNHKGYVMPALYLRVFRYVITCGWVLRGGEDERPSWIPQTYTNESSCTLLWHRVVVAVTDVYKLVANRENNHA